MREIGKVREMGKHCEHGGLIDEDGTVSCQDCDWCSVCERVTAYDGEVCRACGRVWGVDY